MRNGQEIYKDIGTVLYSIAPDKAKKIIMRAELSPENDHCEYEYDYLDDDDKTQWLTAGGRANTDILHYLVELRNYYIENNLTNGRPAWHGCEVTLDVKKMKLNIDFRYDDQPSMSPAFKPGSSYFLAVKFTHNARSRA